MCSTTAGMEAVVAASQSSTVEDLRPQVAEIDMLEPSLIYFAKDGKAINDNSATMGSLQVKTESGFTQPLIIACVISFFSVISVILTIPFNVSVFIFNTLAVLCGGDRSYPSLYQQLLRIPCGRYELTWLPTRAISRAAAL